MALEGNVKDFGLSEIFQLIGLQKKSGMLSVSGEDNIVIFFQDGEVISTRDRRNKTKDPLKDYLLRYGFIGRDEMNRIQHIQAETNLDITDILLSEKYFSEDELKTIFADQIQETMSQVLSWPKSYYKFITGKNVLQGIKTFVSIKVEGLLMESMRRIDEFAEIKRIFPSEELVIKRAPLEEGQREKLEENEEIIYDLLETERSIANLVSNAKMARFCTYEALKNLLEKGLIKIIGEPIEDEEDEDWIEEGDTTRTRRGSLAPTVAALTILIVSFFIGQYAVPYVLPPGWKSSTQYIHEGAETKAGSLGELRRFKVNELKSTIENALEEYRAIKGTYPFTLEVLVVRQVLPERVINEAQSYGMSYKISESGASYRLTCRQTFLRTPRSKAEDG